VEREIYYEFNCFRLYLPERTLECDGVEVRLHGQWHYILLVLLKRRGYKVANRELIEAIWPGHKKKDRADNLYVELAGLRKALTDASPEASEVIKNFRGEGYSFTAEVYAHQVPTTVVIHPFTHEASPRLPDEAGQRMADTLATMLNKNLSIRVVPSITAIKEYNERPELSTLAFGHRLGADHVFSGSIGRGQVKVSHLYVHTAETFGPHVITTSDPESFETYRLILKWMESELKLTPTDEEVQQSRKQYTTNAKANELYNKGRNQRFKGTEASLRRALRYFSRATEEDPKFARAYANFADTLIFMGMMNLLAPEECYESASDAAAKARELDPTMASAHTTWAFTKLFFERGWKEARDGFEEAIAINPNYSVARMGYAHYFISQGHRNEAKRQIDEAMALNPYSFFISFVRGMVYFLVREYDESLKKFEWTHELNLRFNLKSDLSHYGRSLAHEYMALSATSPNLREAEFKSADDEARLAVIVSDGHPVKLLHRAHVNIMWGRTDEAKRLLDKVLEMRQGHYVSPYHLATVYAAMGEDERAIDSLEDAREVRDQYLFLIGIDPRLDSLHSHPRFRLLLSSIGLKA
jgi:tetratricopeptide (TPR) repeat protein/DNA-binding winged helix-turn-helix (wHTH) protein